MVDFMFSIKNQKSRIRLMDLPLTDLLPRTV
jgi:hypothetical protein